MKKIVFLISALLVFATTAYAAGPSNVRSNCGCGLGYILSRIPRTLVFLSRFLRLQQTVLLVTRPSVFLQEPLAAVSLQPLAKTEQMNKFVAENMDSLAVDIAAGQGETLDALAEIAEVAPAKRPQLYSALQKNFEKIYFRDDVNNQTVVSSVTGIIASN